MDVGRDALLPVSDDCANKGDFRFTPGALGKVEIEVRERPQRFTALPQTGG
jgi:hypothetical protein